MNTHTLTRTTVSIHPAIIQRLKAYAGQQGKTMSAIIEEGIRNVISQTEHAYVSHIYTVLKELDGSGGKGVKDASTTINDTLYGERGSWKGKNN